jgi:hypothetical protein
VGAVARLGERHAAAEGPAIFFCQMGPIRIRETLTPGDDAALPHTAAVDGVVVAEPGYYDLLNVLVRTNGDIRLVVDEATRVERVSAWPAEEPWL